MARELSAGLQALIDSGHCMWFSTVVVTLTDPNIPPIYLGTGEHEIDNKIFVAQLTQVEPFLASLTREQDFIVFRVNNVDTVMGQLLTGQTRMLDGATGMLGIIFINGDTGEAFYDEKMPGDIMSADVLAPDVGFELVSAIDAVQVSGETWSSSFPWREPLASARVNDIDDLITDDDNDRIIIIGGRRGRYPIDWGGIDGVTFEERTVV